MIDLTPLEVRKKKGDFRRAMRGYDPAQVDDFLDLVADRLDELVRQNLDLKERVTRLEQQVAENRERERALTEALVTAQEMREEVRRQTAQEAEFSRRRAEQEATELRSSATRAGAQMRADAQQEAQQVRSAAQQESSALRARAQQEVADARAALRQEREREEESLRVLRARQEQFVTAYRKFLEEELNELGGISRALGLSGRPTAAARPAARDDDEAPATGRGDVADAAPAAAPGAWLAGTMDDGDVGLAPSAAALFVAADGESALDADPFGVAGLEDAPQDDEALVADLFGSPDEPLEVEPFEVEPFEPEPFEPEPLEPEAGPASAHSGGDSADAAGAEPLPGEHEHAAEGGGFPAGPTGALFPDEEEEEVNLLLRNAEAAGYSLEELDEDELLLLDEEVEEDEAGGGDDADGWTPSADNRR
jgi:cell division initiation protein